MKVTKYLTALTTKSVPVGFINSHNSISIDLPKTSMQSGRTFTIQTTNYGKIRHSTYNGVLWKKCVLVRVKADVKIYHRLTLNTKLLRRVERYWQWMSLVSSISFPTKQYNTLFIHVTSRSSWSSFRIRVYILKFKNLIPEAKKLKKYNLLMYICTTKI